eukprot:NODE_973_length_1343_cov_168.101236_g806_i0.p1 GENE.NODE_973_length_1343_cov_168.101236_g806_i0~~NODE_973_length_1343_cov_168.101236_g806_i0.p1  ORF type:complete len:358 (+),score=61.59 NODE_973_length_1343_cov_168.101236_g806_i0:134-1075(+)
MLKKEKLTSLTKHQDLDLAAELRILQKIDHPFVIRLHYALVTSTRLCMVMDFLSGGALLWHINNRRHRPNQGLEESAVMFYAAEVVSALKHLHENDIIYRDMKPENLLLDREGHVVLTDFGLASMNKFGFLICGSAPFMAPEIICQQRYTNAVDWWSFGALLYEMLLGRRLFTGPDESSIFKKVLSHPILFPPFLSLDCRSLLQGMLQRIPKLRFGCEGVRSNSWFASIDWDKLVQRKIAPPFVPDTSGSDTKYFGNVIQEDSGVTECGLPDHQFRDIQYLIDEFSHNKHVVVLPSETYGMPIISENGEIEIL